MSYQFLTAGLLTIAHDAVVAISRFQQVAYQETNPEGAKGKDTSPLIGF